MVLERRRCKIQGGLHKEWELPSQNSWVWGWKWCWSPPIPHRWKIPFIAWILGSFSWDLAQTDRILLRSLFSRSSWTGKFLVFITRGLERAGNPVQFRMEFQVFSRKSCGKQHTWLNPEPPNPPKLRFLGLCPSSFPNGSQLRDLISFNGLNGSHGGVVLHLIPTFWEEKASLELLLFHGNQDLLGEGLGASKGSSIPGIRGFG